MTQTCPVCRGRVAEARAACTAAGGDPAYAWVVYDLERLAKEGHD